MQNKRFWKKFTPTSRSEKCPSSDPKMSSEGRDFYKSRKREVEKRTKKRTIRPEYEPDECRLFYTYTIIARLHTNHIEH